jgi:hypothetical protein
MIVIAAAGMILAMAGAKPAEAKREPPVGTSYGPEPTWERYKELAEAAVRARLIDPDSANFTWTGGYLKRGFTPLFSKRIYGYSTCGIVNSKNRLGGYVGRTMFVVVIDYDRVLYTELGKPGGYDMLSEACEKAPPLPPISDMPTAAAPDQGASGHAIGFTIQPMPEGAYVTSVTPGSAAAQAGLTAGMVIASVNDISLAHMGTAIKQLLDGVRGRISLSIVGGKLISFAVPASGKTEKVMFQ